MNNYNECININEDELKKYNKKTDEQCGKMVGISPCKESYFHLNVFSHIRSRLFWLIVLMASAMAAGVIITHYENVFEVVPLLVAFIPMLMASGGNCGAQTSTLIIRGISTKEINNSHIGKVFIKEATIAFLIGLILAILNSIWVIIVYDNVNIAIVVGLALIGTIVVSKILGCMLPFLAKPLKIDPAVMATPLIMTIIDIFSVWLYFRIAILVMGL